MVAGCPATVTPLTTVDPDPEAALPSVAALALLTTDPIFTSPPGPTATSLRFELASAVPLAPSSALFTDVTMLPALMVPGAPVLARLAPEVTTLSSAWATIFTVPCSYDASGWPPGELA